MKRILTILLLMIMSLPCAGVTLTGGVTYTVETARQEAFDGVVYQIPVSTFSNYLTDPNYAANKKAMKSGQTDLGDRWIGFFSDGSYSVVYKKNRYRVYTYESSGKLCETEIRNSLDFPLKSYKYNLGGNLDGVTLKLSPGESYIYTSSGKLEAHWVGNKAYDTDGRVILQRY